MLPTTDPDTPLSSASRAPLTLGIKSDLSHVWHGHVFRAGVDLVRLRELESFLLRQPRRSGCVSRISAAACWRPGQPLSVRITSRQSATCGRSRRPLRLLRPGRPPRPRSARASDWPITSTGRSPCCTPPTTATSLRRPSSIPCWPVSSATTPPIPASVSATCAPTASTITKLDGRRNLHPRVSLELNAYLHTGRDSFENHEISISRIFVPINFHAARSSGAELVLNMKQLERLGITGRFQYALSQHIFLWTDYRRLCRRRTAGRGRTHRSRVSTRPTPAPRKSSITTAGAVLGGSALRYGSGTIVENGPRLPQHFTCDLATGLTVWNAEPHRLDLEFDVTNVSNSVYQIAKESEEIPIQYAPSRTWAEREVPLLRTPHGAPRPCINTKKLPPRAGAFPATCHQPLATS